MMEVLRFARRQLRQKLIHIECHFSQLPIISIRGPHVQRLLFSSSPPELTALVSQHLESSDGGEVFLQPIALRWLKPIEQPCVVGDESEPDSSSDFFHQIRVATTLAQRKANLFGDVLMAPGMDLGPSRIVTSAAAIDERLLIRFLIAANLLRLGSVIRRDVRGLILSRPIDLPNGRNDIPMNWITTQGDKGLFERG